MVDEINQNQVRVVTQFDEEHITCSSRDLLKRLTDSGAEMNLIKITALTGQVVVNKSEKRNIKSIYNAHLSVP